MSENVGNGESLPTTVIVAAALLLVYGGLMLFCSCSDLAITNTHARDLPGPPINRYQVIALGLVRAAIKFLIGLVLIAAGFGAFRLWPISRSMAFCALLADLLMMIAFTFLVFLVVNLQQGQPFFPNAEGALAIGLLIIFVPYAVWLGFCVPICVLLPWDQGQTTRDSSITWAWPPREASASRPAWRRAAGPPRARPRPRR